MAVRLIEHKTPVEYDGKLMIAIGKSRYETEWKNKMMDWSDLLGRLGHSLQTAESHAEYMKLSKDKQCRIKDIGGFVGGHLKEGRRKTGYVQARQILTLDLDYPPEDLWDQLMDNLELSGAMAVYSTHKHTETNPRYRLIMPLDRDVTPDEYEAIARKIAEKIGIDYFDDTTFQPTRLMYWPSHSADVEPYFRYYDAPFACANDILQEYPDWTDMSYWPESSRMTGLKRRKADKQGNPTEKSGLIGAFCRTYTVPEAIAKFLPDIYTPTAKEDRYTYAAGSTAGGLVVYDGEMFAFSNHATDPACGQLCNAYDLVRIHLFGEEDKDVADDTPINRRPSAKAMLDFLKKDKATMLTNAKDRLDKASEDFQNEDWLAELEVNESGAYKPTVRNARLIFENDPLLQGIAYNELGGFVAVRGELPWDRSKITSNWRENDRAQLFCYMQIKYARFTQGLIDNVFEAVTDSRRFNPLRDYIKDLPDWDGVPRVDTLLIDYLGADDTPYTRAVTRKTLVGAINRVLQPGCKFDTMLVLAGKPGIGKSTLLKKLGGEWFDDSLSLVDTRDKTAAEKLQGKWIMEIGEMQGTRKSDIDVVKGFLSRQDDAYRAAYGRVVQSHPRTCIICGTTNSTDGFLRDTTGNRRFWPVNVDKGSKSVWSLSEDDRSQIWAEALSLASSGETTYLDQELEDEATKMQLKALEVDEREGELSEYLDTMLPEDWYKWDIYKRVDYFQQRDELSAKVEAYEKRTRVCIREIWCECFGLPWSRYERKDGERIKMMLLRIGGWELCEKPEKIGGYGAQRCYHRSVTKE